MAKLALEKEVKSDLNLYLFICRPIKVHMPNETILGVFDYNLERAFAEAQRRTGFIPELKGKENVRQMLKKFKLAPEIKQIKQGIPKGLEGIKSSILFAANEKIVAEKLTKRDISDLKRVARKI